MKPIQSKSFFFFCKDNWQEKHKERTLSALEMSGKCFDHGMLKGNQERDIRKKRREEVQHYKMSRRKLPQIEGHENYYVWVHGRIFFHDSKICEHPAMVVSSMRIQKWPKILFTFTYLLFQSRIFCILTN